MPTGFDERVWERRQLKVKKFEFDMNEEKRKKKEKKNKRVTGME